MQAEVVDGVGITLSHYQDREAQPWHHHEHLNLSLLLSGTFIDESRELGQRQLKPLDMVIHPRGALHRSCPAGSARLSLNLEPMDAWLHSNHFSDVKYRVSSIPELSVSAYQYLLGNESHVADALLEALVTEESKPESGHWYARLSKLIEQCEDWTLSSLAKELSVHPVYFARVFRAKTGKSVTTFLRSRRLVRAAHSFLRPNSSGIDVACKFGYSDEAHFSRHFRSVFGMPPSEAKKRFQIFNQA